MPMETHTVVPGQLEILLPQLATHLHALESGTETLSDFWGWFQKARWDDKLFHTSGMNPLMWAIDTMHWEYWSLPPEPTDAADFAADIRDYASEHEIVLPDVVEGDE